MKHHHGWAVIGMLMLASVTLASVARAQDVVTLEMPYSQIRQEMVGYLGASLLEVPQTDHRPTLQDRLSHAPFLADTSRVGIDLSKLDQHEAAVLRAAASTAGGGLAMTYETFLPPAEKLYVERRYFLGQLAHLKARLGLGTDPLWQSVEVVSLITRGRRRIWYHVRDVLLGTIENLEMRGGPIVYRPETWFLAEELDARGGVSETHVIGKRSDWELDFAIYDRGGTVVAVSPITPDLMRVPTTCFVCHRSTGRIPPFREFPDASGEVNGMTPLVDVKLTPKQAAIVRALSGGHGRARPADDIMGDYTGLAALKLKDILAQPGPHEDWMLPLWKRLVKLVPALEN